MCYRDQLYVDSVLRSYVINALSTELDDVDISSLLPALLVP